MAIDLNKYEQTLKVKYRKTPLSLFHLDSPANIRKWMKIYFPHMSEAQHEAIRDEAYQKQSDLKNLWWRIGNGAFRKLYMRPMHASDYKVSGIGREEFPEKVKDELRNIVLAEAQYHKIWHAHDLMLPKRKRRF
jgi:hypothetical protein